MKLIDKVKPEVLKALKDNNEIRYKFSYKAIMSSLTDVERYRQLSIDQIDQLILFLPEEFHPKCNLESFYGDNILQKKYIL